MKKYILLASILITFIAFHGCIKHPEGGISSSNIVLFSAEEITEESDNTGQFDTTIVATLKGSEFVDDLNSDMFGTTDLPDGLDVTVTRTSATKVNIRIFGTATTHSTCGSGLMSFYFKADAFSDGKLPISFEVPIKVTYINPTLTYSITELDENTTNVGSFPFITITASNGGKFKHDGQVTENGTILTQDVDYIWLDLPAGLTPVVQADSSTQVTVSFTGVADDHTPADDAFAYLKFTDEGLSSSFCSLLAKQKVKFNMYRSVVMFSVDVNSGDLGGRSGADTTCIGAAPELPTEYDSVRAFISVDGADEIQDMAGLYNIPTNVMIESSSSGKVADNWTDLLDGSIDNDLGTAEVSDAAVTYWTGSDENGVVVADTCSGWTSNNSGDNGQIGSSDETDADWLINGSTSACDTAQVLLCVKYIGQ